MKIEKISVTEGGTINLGNYENRRLEIHMEATLDEGEMPEAAQAELWSKARASFADELMRLVRTRVPQERGWDSYTTAEQVSRDLRWSDIFSHLKTVDPAVAAVLEFEMIAEFGTYVAPEPSPLEEAVRLVRMVSVDEGSLEDEDEDEDFEDEPDDEGEMVYGPGEDPEPSVF